MYYYPHNIKDFNNSTRHLTRVERSVYRDSIELYYDTELPLTKNIPELSRRLICRTDEEKQALISILCDFYTEWDDGYYHDRCHEEIEKYRANTTAKAKAGIASAAARKKKATEYNKRSTGVQQNPTNHEPRTSNQEPLKEPIDTNVSIVGNGKSVPDCPHQEIINLYSKNLPMGIQPKNWDGARSALLKTRWREKSNRQNLEWWDRFFEYISKSDFLTGKIDTPGRKRFEINLPWILKKENFGKIIDGVYD